MHIFVRQKVNIHIRLKPIQNSICYDKCETDVTYQELENELSRLNKEIEIMKLKILIVEDEEFSDLLLSLILKEISWEVLHAKNGLEAIELCRNNSDIDLVLMDIKMPKMDGYEATRQIRQFNKNTIIIAQTAYGLVGDREKAIDSGCNEYLSKPIIKSELLSLIQQYFVK